MSVENIVSGGFLTSGAYFKPFSTNPNGQSAIGSERPLWRTSAGHAGMSALCQKRTLRCCTRSPDRRAAAGKVEQTAQATLAGLRRERQAMALFLMAPMIAVSMAPPAPPAITCETMPPILRLPDSAAATTDGSANV